MSDVPPSAEACEVDPDLMRRVAWGMIAGKSKAEIAEAEGISREECEIVCTAPGMFSIMNVWVNFLERRKEGGRKNTRKLTGWCVDHVFQHALERLNRNEIWRLDRLSSVMLDYGFAIVFGWMLGFLDGVMGVPGSRRKVLDDFRQNLVDLLCWAIEVTFREKMLEQCSVELLIAKDGAFQAVIAGREYFELGIGGEPRTVEEVKGQALEALPAAATQQSAPATPTPRRRASARPAAPEPSPDRAVPAAGATSDPAEMPATAPAMRTTSARPRRRWPLRDGRPSAVHARPAIPLPSHGLDPGSTRHPARPPPPH